MAFVFTINGTDFATYIATDGFKWERNDIDAPNSGRDMAGLMHRKIIAKKYKLSITCRPLTATEQRTLFTAIANETVTVSFIAPDTGATYSGTFYNSQKSGNVVQDLGTAAYYDGVSFDLIEV